MLFAYASLGPRNLCRGSLSFTVRMPTHTHTHSHDVLNATFELTSQYKRCSQMQHTRITVICVSCLKISKSRIRLFACTFCSGIRPFIHVKHPLMIRIYKFMWHNCLFVYLCLSHSFSPIFRFARSIWVECAVWLYDVDVCVCVPDKVQKRAPTFHSVRLCFSVFYCVRDGPNQTYGIVKAFIYAKL